MWSSLLDPNGVIRERSGGVPIWHRGSESSVQCGSRVPRWSVGMPPSAAETLRAWLLSALVVHGAVAGNPDAKRLYDDLLSNYNKLVRPVVNTSDVLRVCIKLKLSQLIDVNLKNQIMTTNLWVEQSWYDYKLRWEPKEYGGVHMLHVPSDHIWRPDIVLYNNADGNFEVTLATKATIYHQGLVEWKPPAIYKSSCEIDVEYFPFDEQTCVLKFGSWTYDGFKVFWVCVSGCGVSGNFGGCPAPRCVKAPGGNGVDRWQPPPGCDADGNYEVTLMTKATVYYNGLVVWQPPAVYKSSCAIDVEFFPYDVQTCVLKLGSWTYDGFKVDLRHMDEKAGSNVVDVGVDLSEFYMSVEWDILEVPAVRNEKFYTCCDEPYLDITFNITMRRKTLFYTVNIIIPCMGISFLTVLTFYLPSDSGEKVTLSISILISLHVFFLLVVEIIPPTSLVVPLLGKYLIFAMILVSISICVTVVVLNVHFRSPQTHKMSPWVKRVFIHILPRLLVMKRPQYVFETNSRFLMRGREPSTCLYPYHTTVQRDDCSPKRRYPTRTPSKEDLSPSLEDGGPFGGSCQIHGPVAIPHSESEDLTVSAEADNGIKSPVLRNPGFSHSRCPPEIHKSCFCVRFIAEHTKMLEDSTKVKEDWKYVAMVLDRLFLWIFTLAVLVGTAGIILQAPTLYDDRIPIDKKFEEYTTTTVVRCPPPQ
ncbi:nicotinic acetylcholine receptor subunit alpha4 [Tribolium castaneum]|uniref:Nicotinic acetylcholine receptor subunit alpha4 n=1 Tax=Tribolium castaneum TaxID=7070 RepID=A0A139WN87_TRICA|nr:nicotinic acetylcholine receptor subunit alpha4 [Tribolium castaneum]